MGVLDLFDDEPDSAPDGQPPTVNDRRRELGEAEVDEGKPAPTYQHHVCSARGCWAEGCYGQGLEIATSTWYCRKHVPEGFLPKRSSASP